MGTLEQIKNELEKFQVTAEETAVALAVNYEHLIIDWNVENLNKGEYYTKKTIEPPYVPLTVRIKRQKGQPVVKGPTLRDEGDFHDSFFLVKNKLSFAVYATDDKTEKLERKYSPEIFGINDTQLEELNKLVKADMQEAFKSAILQ